MHFHEKSRDNVFLDFSLQKLLFSIHFRYTKSQNAMSNTFFITTPIYYSNGIPHIGHAYSSLLADTIAAYKRFSGKEVKLVTGVDENSQKVVESAEAVGM
jgi:valyl-tRNA synthetase